MLHDNVMCLYKMFKQYTSFALHIIILTFLKHYFLCVAGITQTVYGLIIQHQLVQIGEGQFIDEGQMARVLITKE